MDKAARHAANLNVLSRHDNTIIDILDSSSHVVLYAFDHKHKSWTKRGIEGTMFVFRRSKEPYYGIFVMNRLGVENLMVLLNADMEVQLLQEFVIYRNPDDSVQGLWMYEPADRARLVKTLRTYTQLSVGAVPDAATIGVITPAVDLMAMFERAKTIGQVFPVEHAPNERWNDNCTMGAHDSVAQLTHVRQTSTGAREAAIATIQSAPPITPQQRQIQRLPDIWQWVEDIVPEQMRGGLSDLEFRKRMGYLMQDANFLDAMYRSYRWERPT